MSDGEKRLRDLKDASDHEVKMKAALDKAKTDLAAGMGAAKGATHASCRHGGLRVALSNARACALVQARQEAVCLARNLCPSRS